MRMGWIVAPSEVMDKLITVKQAQTYTQIISPKGWSTSTLGITMLMSISRT